MKLYCQEQQQQSKNKNEKELSFLSLKNWKGEGSVIINKFKEDTSLKVKFRYKDMCIIFSGL